jgi:cytochrome c biogenesis protein CcmG/thiol:disulfide interchange protein DsbE
VSGVNRRVLIVGLLFALPIVGLLFVSLGRNPNRLDAPVVGRSAPPFRLLLVGGGAPITLESLRGKPAVLNFWATWCGPCLDEHPVLVGAARTLGAEVQFVGVVYEDSEAAVADYLRRHGNAYPAVVDPGGRAAIAYGVYGVPETFFIDASGVVAQKQTGPLTAEKLAELLASTRGTARAAATEAAR